MVLIFGDVEDNFWSMRNRINYTVLYISQTTLLVKVIVVEVSAVSSRLEALIFGDISASLFPVNIAIHVWILFMCIMYSSELCENTGVQ